MDSLSDIFSHWQAKFHTSANLKIRVFWLMDSDNCQIANNHGVTNARIAEMVDPPLPATVGMDLGSEARVEASYGVYYKPPNPTR